MKNPIITMCNAGKDQTAGQKPRGTKRKGNSNIQTHDEPKSVENIADNFVPSMIPQNRSDDTPVEIHCDEFRSQQPPALAIHIPMRSFCLKWRAGNISSCCGRGLAFPNMPSKDIEKFIIVYRDDRFVYGKSVLNKLQNVHFRLNPLCIRKKYPDFHFSNLIILRNVLSTLSAEVKDYLNNVFEFGM